MDPISIASLSAAIAKTAFFCSKSIYGFVDGNLSINKNINLLHNEAIALHNNAAGLSDMLKRPEMAHFHDAEVWDHANEALDRCQKPLDELQNVLRGLRPSRNRKWTSGDVLRVIQGNMQESTLDRLRAQLHSHNLELAGIQGRIIMLVTVKGHMELRREFLELREDINTQSSVVVRQSATGDMGTDPEHRQQYNSPTEQNIVQNEEGVSRFKQKSSRAEQQNKTVQYDEKTTECQGKEAKHDKDEAQSTRNPAQASTEALWHTQQTDSASQSDPLEECVIKSWTTCRAEGFESKQLLHAWREALGHDLETTDPDSILSESLSGTFSRLHWAVIACNRHEVMEFLSQNDFVDGSRYRSYRSSTPLHVACVMGFSDVTSLLLDNGADVNRTLTLDMSPYEISPLQLALRANQVQIMSILLKRGASIQLNDDLFSTAISRQNVPAVRVLLDHDFPIDLWTWHEAIRPASLHEDYAYLVALIEHGGDYQQAIKDSDPRSVKHIMHAAKLAGKITESYCMVQ
jgi:hypothetical protein